MKSTHPIDIFAAKLNPMIRLLALLCAPVMLASYAWMLWRMVHDAPPLIVAIVMASHLVGWLGIAALIDTRRQRRT